MKIDFSSFSQKAQAIAQQSYEVVLRYHHNQITRGHILLASLGTANEDIIKLLEGLNVNVPDARKRLKFLVSNRLPTVPVKEIKPNRVTTTIQVKRFIEHSRIEADRLGEKIISSEILFLALVQSYFRKPGTDRTVQELLTSFGITPEAIRKAVLAKLFSELSID